MHPPATRRRAADAKPRRRWVALAALALGHIALAPTAVRAQYVGGQAVEKGSGKPVEGLQVFLLLRDSTDIFDVVHRTTTDSNGFFHSYGTRQGVYRIAFGDSLAPISMSSEDTLTAESASQRRFFIPVHEHVFEAHELDVLAHPLPGKGGPKYPPNMRQCGMGGSVTMRMVVDTMGRVEGSTVETTWATTVEFERAVRDYLPQQRFEPARWRGWTVRARVVMPFTFVIDRRSIPTWPDTTWPMQATILLDECRKTKK